jgi:hypothetical protein
MNEYFAKWLRIIEEMQNSNTYKLAWGRAILELCCLERSVQDEITFSFDQISELFLKYFWNQSYFFDLRQGPKGTKPKIQKITDELLELHKSSSKSNIPLWFDNAKVSLTGTKAYKRTIRKITATLKVNVARRFCNVIDGSLEVYKLDLVNETVSLSPYEVHTLKEHSYILFQLLNYRWAQLLELYNHDPKVIMKVKGLSESKIRRNSLREFRDLLLLEFPDGNVKDFYTGEIIDIQDVSVDHVIPWSYMYSDDIWNLVITSKQRNSKKSNHKVDEHVINNLINRNTRLAELLPQKYRSELNQSIKSNTLESFYFNFANK